MTIYGHDAKRVAEYILWLANRDRNPLTPMQVLKLVYICHGWMLGLTGRPLIRESAQAWTYGPVVPSVYHQYKTWGGNSILDGPESKPKGFEPIEERIIEQVWGAESTQVCSFRR